MASILNHGLLSHVSQPLSSRPVNTYAHYDIALSSRRVAYQRKLSGPRV